MFIIITGINESKTLIKYLSCNCNCKFDGRKCNWKQKWSNDKCQCKCKKTINHSVCEEDHAWILAICACESDKDCDIDKYLKNFASMKSLT